MKISIQLIVLSTIILISNEQAICEGGTCNFGDTCQEGSTGGFEKFYCDLNKGIYCKTTCL